MALLSPPMQTVEHKINMQSAFIQAPKYRFLENSESLERIWVQVPPHHSARRQTPSQRCVFLFVIRVFQAHTQTFYVKGRAVFRLWFTVHQKCGDPFL